MVFAVSFFIIATVLSVSFLIYKVSLINKDLEKKQAKLKELELNLLAVKLANEKLSSITGTSNKDVPSVE